MVLLDLVLRRIKVGYKFISNKEEINHLMLMDDIKSVAKDEKGLESLIQTVRVISTDIDMKLGLVVTRNVTSKQTQTHSQPTSTAEHTASKNTAII